MFLREVAKDEKSYPYITLVGQHTIGAIPKWDNGKTVLGATKLYYTPELETVEINVPAGKQYILLIADIKENIPSAQCFYTVFLEDDEMKMALLVAPLEEYISKYYE